MQVGYRPQGPWTIDQINGGMVELAYSTRKLRAESKGTLRLYRITGDESQTKDGLRRTDKDESGSMPPSKEIVRHAVPPDSGLGMVTRLSSGGRSDHLLRKGDEYHRRPTVCANAGSSGAAIVMPITKRAARLKAALRE